MKNKKDNKPYFDEREVFIKTINEKDKRIAELEAECAVMGNTATQFTAEEINGIRKVAQFSGLMIANSIIAKCDAMLKGAEE